MTDHYLEKDFSPFVYFLHFCVSSISILKLIPHPTPTPESHYSFTNNFFSTLSFNRSVKLRFGASKTIYFSFFFFFSKLCCLLHFYSLCNHWEFYFTCAFLLSIYLSWLWVRLIGFDKIHWIFMAFLTLFGFYFEVFSNYPEGFHDVNNIVSS